MAFADTNYMRITRIREATWGVTPVSGNPTELRITGQSLNSNIQYIRSEELRSDRMTADTVLVDSEANGNIPVEMSFGNADDLLEGALMNPWSKVPEIVNVTADTEISGVDSATDTITVASGGASFVAGHLVELTGFTNAANNSVFEVLSSTGTTIVVDGPLTDEAVVPVDAKVKVVGFVGASGDITATATGLASTTLDFTTLGIKTGSWIKVGGTATADKFTTTAVNGWARVSAVSANAITLENRPSGWAADTGTGKTIKVWIGDLLKNGTDRSVNQFSIEREHTDIGEFFLFGGMMVNTTAFNIATGAILTADFGFMGKNAVRDVATGMPGSIQDAPTGDVMNAVRDIVTILEGGTAAGTLQSLTLNWNNNLRAQKGVGTVGNIGVGIGDFEATVDFTAYFEQGGIYDKYENDTETSLAWVVTQDGQAYAFDLPRGKVEACTIQAGARNQDATLQATFRALRHPTLVAQQLITRLQYFES